MGAEAAVFWPYESLRDRCRAETYTLNSGEIYSLPHRMEAGFYASEGYRSVQAMEKAGFEITTIGDLSEVLWFGPFARKYVTDKEKGIPFLSSSNMMEARPRDYNLISKKHTKNLSKYIVYENTILVSCSGTVGNIALVTKDQDGWAVSQHAIRVIVDSYNDLGPIYCFFQSPVGQFLLKRSKSGSVVDSIYDKDVAPLPIPKLPLRLRQELTRLVKKAADLRVEANRLLDEAEREVFCQNGISVEQIDNVSPLSFKSNSSFLFKSGRICDQNRLDASYYNPIAVKVIQLISECSKSEYLGEMVEDIVLIGKTFVPGVYKVDEGHGIPFLTGKELFKYRIFINTFIASNKKQNIERLIVLKGYTLITCAGTVGKVIYVGKELNNIAVTHDAIRVIPNSKLDGGYIYSFLSSKLGQLQLDKYKYGSVIPRLHKTQISSILIPIPEDRGKSIGSIVEEAFRLRYNAIESEDTAFDLFISSIKMGRKKTEETWGVEY